MKKILLSLLIMTSAGIKAQMAGPLSSSSLMNVGAGSNWVISSNISVTTPSAASSAFLTGINFGFSISATATITGIVLQTPGFTSNVFNGSNDTVVMLVKNLVPVGNNHGKPGYIFAGASMTYGNSSDLWGAAWTPADINNSNFGFEYKQQNMVNTSNMFVWAGGSFSMTVYYSTSTGIVSETKSVDLLNAYSSGSQVTIKNNGNLELENANLCLTNLLGQKIFSQKMVSDKSAPDIKISLPEHMNGVYILSIDKENLHYAKKLYIE
jgi:hypothetical protein